MYAILIISAMHYSQKSVKRSTISSSRMGLWAGTYFMLVWQHVRMRVCLVRNISHTYTCTCMPGWRRGFALRKKKLRRGCAIAVPNYMYFLSRNGLGFVDYTVQGRYLPFAVQYANPKAGSFCSFGCSSVPICERKNNTESRLGCCNLSLHVHVYWSRLLYFHVWGGPKIFGVVISRRTGSSLGFWV